MNQRELLKLLFDAASATLLDFGRSELGGQVGFTLVLHTWDQQLRPHFHLHGLIASGALSADHSQWRAGGSKFLFPVRALSKVFRGKFLSGLGLLLGAGELDRPRSQGKEVGVERRLLRQLSKKSWVVYSKAPFDGPRKLLDCLSRYTHRVAISNERLVGCDNGQVTFAYRDRTDGDRRKRQRHWPATPKAPCPTIHRDKSSGVSRSPLIQSPRRNSAQLRGIVQQHFIDHCSATNR